MALSPLGGEYKDEKDERLPGAGKGGMVHLAAAGGKVSTIVSVLLSISCGCREHKDLSINLINRVFNISVK